MAPRVRVSVTSGAAEPRELVFEKHDIVVFGRAPHCHYSVPDDPFLSRNHFLIEANPPACVVMDLESSNGTCVNGERRAGRTELKDGDIVSAGTVEARVALEADEPAPVTADPGEVKTWRNFPGLEVQRELGRGAMGKVFLVRMAASGTQAVLKTLTLTSIMEADKRGLYFQREMESTKALRHPNIVAYLDGGRFEGNLYFLLEYCTGGSLQELLDKRGGKLPLEEAKPLMFQALDALGFAHARGFVHRDLKPANLLLADEGGTLTAKIADFGLAKNFKLAGMSGVTECGMAAGSLSFIPREQLTNFLFTQPVSDIFSLGATFYTMLTGAKVYDFDAAKTPLEAVLDGRTVPLGARDRALPELLCRVIDKAVAPDTEARYWSAADFATELSAALG